MNLNFTVNDSDLKAFGIRFSSSKKKQVKIALGDIKREFLAELIRQFDEFPTNGRWKPLNEKYERRKKRDFAAGKIQHLSTLKRTGRMFEGYQRGIRIDEVNYKVIIPYPRASGGDKRVNVRAKVHQGVKLADTGLKPRPLDTESFKEIGRKILRAAITSKGKYSGYNSR